MREPVPTEDRGTGRWGQSLLGAGLREDVRSWEVRHSRACAPGVGRAEPLHSPCGAEVLQADF